MGLPAGMLTPRRPALLLFVLLAGCSADYTPDTYATRAVQQANKVEQGTVAGVRPIGIRADGTTGATAGAAAGGIAGSTVGQGSTAGAFGAIGGGLIGGLLGSAAERATAGAPTVIGLPAAGQVVSTAIGGLASAAHERLSNTVPEEAQKCTS